MVIRHFYDEAQLPPGNLVGHHPRARSCLRQPSPAHPVLGGGGFISCCIYTSQHREAFLLKHSPDFKSRRQLQKAKSLRRPRGTELNPAFRTAQPSAPTASTALSAVSLESLLPTCLASGVLADILLDVKVGQHTKRHQ